MRSDLSADAHRHDCSTCTHYADGEGEDCCEWCGIGFSDDYEPMTDLSALRQSAESCFQQGRMMELKPHEVLALVAEAMREREGRRVEAVKETMGG